MGYLRRREDEDMTEYIAGVPIPDTRLVADMTELAKADAPPLLFHHSRRVYLFGMLQGRRRGLPVVQRRDLVNGAVDGPGLHPDDERDRPAVNRRRGQVGRA